ncbi:hypothetical protein I6F65_06535 [Pseudoalteromonas sp. SWXJZ94C]|uniref:hypothetical protein n=1 Tax=Pseudoalteromonas sp. SWXJZ94C TaxID=2792065 RepID=UPI0018CEDD83|nr:hypothetical protein [Pseudoalteromonas sp. SWXJZ94C]MBH0056612.1 hypothetical protein [Pseudoalteromonas sp. SWXJZ94C]
MKVADKLSKKIDINKHPLRLNKVVASATDSYLTPTYSFNDPYLPGSHNPKYGQDISFASNRASPQNQSVGENASDLKTKMKALLDIFADGDNSGVAKRLFEKYLKKQSHVVVFSDDSLNMSASRHSNIKEFCSRALSAPNSPFRTAGQVRIHQALKNANWDINKIVAPTNLGVPAFNLGSKLFSTQDFDNGLGLMINGVQHVYVIATHYYYDKLNAKYYIKLRFVFYDVFGLDDEDLNEYGAKSDNWMSLSKASVGITAWWQLQHQHAYAPLVTRIVLENSYEVPAK